MKKLKLSLVLLLFVFLGHAQGTYLEFGATVLDADGNPVANHPVTVVDSSNSVLGGSVTTYLTNASGWFQDTILSGTAGTLYMITTDSCQTYYVDTLYTGNTTWLTFTHTFNLCNGATVASCDGSFTAQDSGLFVEILPVAVGTTGFLEFYWGDGTMDTVNAANLPFVPYNHTYAAAGTYTICVFHNQYANGNMICSDSTCTTVTVSALNPMVCNASFIVDTVNSQQGSVVVWNASSVSGNTASTYVTFSWDFGDGTPPSNQQFPVHNYANAGLYQVCLTVTATDPVLGSCTSIYCDSLGVDANGNLIYKGAMLGWTLNVYDINSIGIEEDALSGLKIYPNPASDMVTISLPTDISGNATVKLYNLNGSVIKSVSTNGNELSQTLSIADLPNGMYILSVDVNGSSKQVKIIKQN